MCLNVVLGRVLGVLGCMGVMAVGQVRMVGCCFVVTIPVMLDCFLMVACSVLMMFRCLRVVVRCFV